MDIGRVPDSQYEDYLKRTERENQEWQREAEDEEEEDELGELREEAEETYWSDDRYDDELLSQISQRVVREAESARERRNNLSIELADAIQKIKSNRYFEDRKRKPPVISIISWFEQERLQSNRAFRTTFRLGKCAFHHLVSKIETHLVFHNKSNFQQTAVEHQLAVFLRRIGSKGMGGSHWDLALGVGVGEGTISLFCERVLTAILTLGMEFITWPTRTERSSHYKRVCDASLGVFPGVVGFVDGTFVILDSAPLKDWYSYYNRKSTYGLNAMVVCDDHRTITYLRIGDTSAVHDARVFEQSQLSLHPTGFFNKNEYLLGDTAYTTNDHMITPFKQPRAKGSNEQMFNATLSARHVVIENTFGLLKARFPGITHISIKIRDQSTHKRVVNYFEVACIIHNFLLQEETEDDWEDPEDLEHARRHQNMIEQISKEREQARGEKNQRRKDDDLRESLFLHMVRNIA